MKSGYSPALREYVDDYSSEMKTEQVLDDGDDGLEVELNHVVVPMKMKTTTAEVPGSMINTPSEATAFKFEEFKNQDIVKMHNVYCYLEISC
jgi:hypothetical protein